MEIEYSLDHKTASVDGLRFTRDENTGYYLSTRAIDGARKRLHIYIWEKHNGKIPTGYHVHHKTMDKSCNEIEDLELCTVHEHQKIHAESMNESSKQRARDNLINKAIPKAIEWHKKASVEAWKNRKSIKYTCTNCGKEFESRNIYSKSENRFCSNKCKSAWRRKSGVDNETRECSICGSKFTANKYSSAKRCKKCGNIKYTQGRQ